MKGHIKEAKVQGVIRNHYDNGGNAFKLDGDIFAVQCEVNIGDGNRVDIAITHGEKNKLQVTIIEVKSTNLRSTHMAQVCRYKKSIESSKPFKSIYKFNYIIIGKKPISMASTCMDPYYIASCVDDLSVFHYSKDNDGICISGFMGVLSDPFKAISIAGGKNEKINCNEMIASFTENSKL